MMRVLPLGAVVGFLLAVACDRAHGQISAQEGRWVVDHGNDIASKTADYIKSEYSPQRNPAAAIQTADLVRLVTADPASWRFYSRDRGILVAIDAGTDVSLSTLRNGPATIAQSVEAIIRQERAMAIKGRVTVVFIEPELRELDERCQQYTPTFFRTPSSGAVASGFATGPLSPSDSACGCR